MPQLIQRPPTGILGLLDSKVGGLNPNALADEVRLTLDTTKFYGIQTRFSVNSAIAAPVLGLNVFPVTLGEPPPGEIWIMHRITVRTSAVIAVAATFRFAAGVNDTRNTGFTMLGDVASAVLVGEYLISGGDVGYLWRAGDQAAVFVLNATNAAALTCNVVFDRVTT